MRKILALLLLICCTIAIANPMFKQELADSLILHLKADIINSESYYLINSRHAKLDSYLRQKLGDLSVDLRTEKDKASKSISYSVKEEVKLISRKSFLFSRKVQQTEFIAEAAIIDNKSSKIEQQINISKLEESPVEDGEITIWKSVLISLMAGTLIYSLWSIE